MRNYYTIIKLGVLFLLFFLLICTPILAEPFYFKPQEGAGDPNDKQITYLRQVQLVLNPKEIPGEVVWDVFHISDNNDNTLVDIIDPNYIPGQYQAYSEDMSKHMLSAKDAKSEKWVYNVGLPFTYNYKIVNISNDKTGRIGITFWKHNPQYSWNDKKGWTKSDTYWATVKMRDRSAPNSLTVNPLYRDRYDGGSFTLEWDTAAKTSFIQNYEIYGGPPGHPYPGDPSDPKTFFFRTEGVVRNKSFSSGRMLFQASDLSFLDNDYAGAAANARKSIYAALQRAKVIDNNGAINVQLAQSIIDDQHFVSHLSAYDYSGRVYFDPGHLSYGVAGLDTSALKTKYLVPKGYIQSVDNSGTKFVLLARLDPNIQNFPDINELPVTMAGEWDGDTFKMKYGFLKRDGTLVTRDEYNKETIISRGHQDVYKWHEEFAVNSLRDAFTRQEREIFRVIKNFIAFNKYFPNPSKEPNYEKVAPLVFLVRPIFKDGSTGNFSSPFKFTYDFYPPAVPTVDTKAFPNGKLKEIKTLSGTVRDVIPDNKNPGTFIRGGTGISKVQVKTRRSNGLGGLCQYWTGTGWKNGELSDYTNENNWFTATVEPGAVVAIAILRPNEDGGKGRVVQIRTTDPDKWTIDNSAHYVKANLGGWPAHNIYFLPSPEKQNLNDAAVTVDQFDNMILPKEAIWTALVKAGYIEDSTGAIKPSFDNLTVGRFQTDLKLSAEEKDKVFNVLKTVYDASNNYSYDIYKRSVDKSGNYSYNYGQPENVTTIYLYRTPPSVNFSIKAPVAEGFTYRRSVSLSFKNPDDTYAPLVYQVRNENDKDYVDCTAKLNRDNEYADWIIPEGEGKKTVYARVTDRLGNVFETSAAIVLDLTPPTGTIVINDGQPYTNNKNIKLHLKAEDAPSGINTMSFSDDNGENWIQPVAYAETYDWNLSADGNKTLLVQFMDKAGNNIEVNASIYLDTTAPDLRLLTPADGAYLSDLQLITGEAWDIDPDDYKKKSGSGIDKVQVRLKRIEAGKYRYWNWAEKKWGDLEVEKDEQSAQYWQSGVVTPVKGENPDQWTISANLPAKDDWAEGDYEISAKAFDKAGNPSNYSRTSSVTIQKSPPSNAELNLKGPVGWVNGRIDEPAEFRWDTPKNAVSYYWLVNKPPTPDLKPIEENKIILDKAKLLPNAENTFYLAAANKAGVADFAGAASYKFKYDPDSPPKPELSINPGNNWMNAVRKDSPNVKGWTISWKEQANNPSGIAIAHWKLDDKEFDRAAAVNNSVKINPSSFNLADGAHKVTVYLEDGAGNSEPANTAEVMLYYDNTNPTAPNAPCNAWKDNIKNPPEKIQTNAPFNYAAPYFEWSGAQDQLPGSGIRGYMVYFGPVEDDKLAVNLQPDANYQAKQLAPGTYYLIVKTVDWAGNESSGITLFKYIYDQNAVNFPPLVPSNVTLNKNNLTGKLVLSWDAVNLPFDRKADSYKVYKSKDPSYFNRYFSFYSGPETTTTDDIAADANYYIVTAQNKAGESDSSKVFGYYAANLVPGSNWVSIPFVNAKMSRAADIWTSLGLEAGDKVQAPDPSTEKFTNSYDGINGDFAIQWGKNYRITTAKRRVWVMAGAFGNDETGLFKLVQGINWIYLPYAKADIKTAKKLWQNLGLSYGDRIESTGLAQGFYGGEYQDPDLGLTKIGNENLPIQTYQSYRIIVNSQLLKPTWP